MLQVRVPAPRRQQEPRQSQNVDDIPRLPRNMCLKVGSWVQATRNYSRHGKQITHFRTPRPAPPQSHLDAESIEQRHKQQGHCHVRFDDIYSGPLTSNAAALCVVPATSRIGAAGRHTATKNAMHNCVTWCLQWPHYRSQAAQNWTLCYAGASNFLPH